MTARPTIVKFGGELIEHPAHLATAVTVVERMAGVPLVVVHGGGREIDAALTRAGLDKRQVDGLRITDEATLDVVVAVLAGTVNTRLVAALRAAGVNGVGLTGADGGCAVADVAPPHRAADGRLVDLGRVGLPRTDADVTLLRTLMAAGFVPVIASIGTTSGGQLLNVNADALAGHVAARLKARRLVIAGTTAGVLHSDGSTLASLDPDAIARLIGSGTATAGMIAKLRACGAALAAGVGDVLIVDGRDAGALRAAVLDDEPAVGTRLTKGAEAPVSARGDR